MFLAVQPNFNLFLKNLKIRLCSEFKKRLNVKGEVFSKTRQIKFLLFRLLSQPIRSLQNSKKFAKKAKIWFDELFFVVENISPFSINRHIFIQIRNSQYQIGIEYCPDSYFFIFSPYSSTSSTSTEGGLVLSVASLNNSSNGSKRPNSGNNNTTTTTNSSSSIGKKHALKKYDQFALNTSCFWGSTGSNITPGVQFHESFVTKIMNILIYYYCWSKNFVKLHNWGNIWSGTSPKLANI